jgi:excinuclease ABC subunit B
VQTIGRAARNERGKVIMYADKMTKSMEEAISETNRRRSIQMAYNKEHNITPTTILKSKDEIMGQTKVADSSLTARQYYVEEEHKQTIAADPVVGYMDKAELAKLADRLRKEMEKAAKDLDFIEAARFRDEYLAVLELLEKK